MRAAKAAVDMVVKDVAGTSTAAAVTVLVKAAVTPAALPAVLSIKAPKATPSPVVAVFAEGLKSSIAMVTSVPSP